MFARSGYHGAGLDEIARVAGFSKGAVYSNFSNKADLFLAVMDANLEIAGGETWDPFERVTAVVSERRTDREIADVEQVGRGVALATLEFIAVAVRDPDLAPALRDRVETMIELYSRMAAEHAREDDPLPRSEIAALLAAFDQGMSLLWLSGAGGADQRSLRLGLRRLLDPERASADLRQMSDTEARGGSTLDPILTRVVADELRRDEEGTR